MRRLLFALLTASLLVTGCAAEELGREPPMCRIDPDDVPSSVVLTLQAVPTAQYIPCIDELHAGWDVEPLTAASGRAQFVLDSDRHGLGFLTVNLSAACDPGPAIRGMSTEPGTQLWEQIHERVTSARVAVLPATDRQRRFAEWTAAILETRDVVGLSIDATTAPSPEPIADRISSARAGATTVLVVDDSDVRDGTASIRHPDGSAEAGLDLDDLVEAIGRAAPEPVYRATWTYVFTGGCVTIDIDAAGPGATAMADEVDDAISMRDARPLRQLLRAEGYESVG